MKAFLISLAFLFTFSGCEAKTTLDQVVLSKNNTIILNSEVDDASVAKILVKAMELDKELAKGKPLYLVLNTPGGSIQAGMELIDGLQGLKRPIHTVTMFAASMGFQIAQNLNDRLIVGSGTLMSHRAKGSVCGEFGGQEPSQLSNRYAFWVNRLKQLDTQTVKRSNKKQTLESYTKAYANELWIGSEASVTSGYADRSVTVKCDNTLSGTTEQNFVYFGIMITVKLSDCPTVTGALDVSMKIKTSTGFVLIEDFIKNGGMFGTACAIANQNKSALLCPEDLSITMEKLDLIKKDVIIKNNKTWGPQDIIYNYRVF